MRRAKLFGLFTFAAIAAASCLISSSTAATIQTQWDIEGLTTPPDLANSVAGPAVLASTGVGTATGLHASVNTDWTTPVGNGSANSYSSNEWAIGDYYQFQTNTLGVGGVQLSWGQTRSSTGPSNFDLRWSIDGINFTTAMSYVVPALTWSSNPINFMPGSVFTANLQSVGALNDQAAVYFRLVATSAGSAAAGSNRVDDFTVSVPEPASVALLSLAAVGMLGIRRRVC